MSIKIDRVETYRIRNGANTRSFYRTLRGAFGRIAWWMIFEKYTANPNVHHRADIIKPSRFECECGEDWQEDVYHHAGYEPCELHNRDWGYYKKLHDRLVEYLILYYESADFPSDFNRLNP